MFGLVQEQNVTPCSCIKLPDNLVLGVFVPARVWVTILRSFGTRVMYKEAVEVWACMSLTRGFLILDLHTEP